MNLNYETELCRAASGRHYVEVYALADLGRRLVHTTARRDDPAVAEALAAEWIAFTNRQAARVRCGEAVPAVA